EIYEIKHPETKRGGDYGNQYTGGKDRLSEIISFSQDTVAKTGLTPRTIRQEGPLASIKAKDKAVHTNLTFFCLFFLNGWRHNRLTSYKEGGLSHAQDINR